MQHPPQFLLAAALAVATSSVASAQYTSDFEALSASAAGTAVTGQDGYYVPAGTTSVDFLAFTYAGNALGLPQNPTGGNQFIAGTGPGSPAFARAQRDLTWGTGVWTVGYDIAATFTGTLPSAQNAGSVSMQPFPGSQAFIALARWVDPLTAANWNADFVWFDAAGTQLTESVGDPGFQNLDINKWYRWETDIDLTTNEVVEVRLTDVMAGTTVTNNPAGRYLMGGAAGGTLPTGFRFFGGGGVDGNTLAFDNPSIKPGPGYASGFEDAMASASGTVFTGQDNFYTPAGTTSVDFLAFSYSGNTLGLPQNPTGGDQFIAGTGPGSPAFARAQRDLEWGTGVWTVGYDIAATFTGMLPSAQNAGSVSMQPFPGSQAFIALARWVDPLTAANWNADFVWFDAAGTQLTESVGDPGFQNLDTNKWYRWETDINLTTNEVVEVRLTDIAAGTTVANNPVGRYLMGGAAGSTPPTGFRFFGGGGVDGNTLAFDNADINEASGSIGTSICSPAVANSTGQPGVISVAGSATAADNDLTLFGSQLPMNSNGFFFTSRETNLVVMPGGSVGNICIASFAIGRYDGNILNSGMSGEVNLALDLASTPLQPGGPVSIMAGETWYWQYWYRDTVVGGGAGSNFTDAIGITFN